MSSVVGEGATENKIISWSRGRPRLPQGRLRWVLGSLAGGEGTKR